MLRFALSRSSARHFCSASAERQDCIIAGGGMVGATLACSLASNPLFSNTKFLLVEGGPQKHFLFTPGEYSNRVSSVNSESIKVLDQAGLWKHINGFRAQKIERIEVWGSYSTNSTNFVHDADGMAYVIENDVILGAAYKVLSSLKNVTILHNTKVQAVTKSANFDLPQVKLSNGKSYESHLLISASGAQCPVRSSLGVNYLAWNYNHKGVVATLMLGPMNSNNIAWQRFTPEGTVAILPLSLNQSSLVWSVPPSKAEKLLGLPDDLFVDELNKALSEPSINDPLVEFTNSTLSSLLKNMTPKKTEKQLLPPYITGLVENSRASFPLSFGHSSKYIGHRIALIGDAAHKIHPLAGQGVNLGLSDIRFLTEVLSKGKLEGRILGDHLDLEMYETKSQRHNVPIMAAVDMFYRLYVTDNPVLKVVGDAAFKIADTLNPLKAGMKQFAAGSKVI